MSKPKRNTPTHYAGSLTLPAPGSLYEFLLEAAARYRDYGNEKSALARIRRDIRPFREQAVAELTAAGHGERIRDPIFAAIVSDAVMFRYREWMRDGRDEASIYAAAEEKALADAAAKERRSGTEPKSPWAKELCQDVIWAYIDAERLTSNTVIAARLNSGCHAKGSGLEAHHVMRARKAQNEYLARLTGRSRDPARVDQAMRAAKDARLGNATFMLAMLAIHNAAEKHPAWKRYGGRELVREIDMTLDRGIADCLDWTFRGFDRLEPRERPILAPAVAELVRDSWTRTA